MLLIVAFIILKSVKIVKCVETLQSQINYTSTTSRPSTPTWPKLSIEDGDLSSFAPHRPPSIGPFTTVTPGILHAGYSSC